MLDQKADAQLDIFGVSLDADPPEAVKKVSEANCTQETDVWRDPQF